MADQARERPGRQSELDPKQRRAVDRDVTQRRHRVHHGLSATGTDLDHRSLSNGSLASRSTSAQKRRTGSQSTPAWVDRLGREQAAATRSRRSACDRHHRHTDSAGAEPTAIAISADGTTAYVTDSSTGQMHPDHPGHGYSRNTDQRRPGAERDRAGTAGLASPRSRSQAAGGSSARKRLEADDARKPAVVGDGLAAGSSGTSSTAQTCRAPGSTITVRVTRKTLPARRQARRCVT